MYRRRAFLVALAAAAVFCGVLLAQRTDTAAELLHVGALTAQMDAQDGLYAEGGSDDYSMPTRRAMFTERTAGEPSEKTVKAAKVTRRPAPSAVNEGLSAHEKAARAAEGDHAAGEYEAAEKTQSKLALRDAELEDVADKGASDLLASYNDAVNGAVDEYSKISQRVDARSERAFEGLPARGGRRASKHVLGKTAKGKQATGRGARRANAIEPGDPLADQKNVFNRLGVSGSLYGVPREYRGEVDATGGARAVKSRVPGYVRRAAHEAADADYIRDRTVPERPSSAGAPKRYLDQVQKQARAPLLKVAHGESLKQIINTAVKSALAKQPNPSLSSFMSEESQDRAAARAHPMGLSQNTFNPATSTSTLAQLPERRAAEREARQAAARAKALQLPAASAHQVQAQAFHSAWNHLNDQIDTIFGPSRAELRRRAARRARIGRRQADAAQVARVRQMARAVTGKDALPAAKRQQQVLSAQDAAMQAKERDEVEALKRQVKKLREKAEVRRLKEQVGKLRQQVLLNEQRQVLQEEQEDKAEVDSASIKDAFDAVDSDGDEAISVDEVRAALKDLDLNIADDLLDEVLKSEGIEAKDAVDLQGFTDVVARVQEKLEELGNTPRVCEDRLRSIFDSLDADHDGAMTKDELSQGLGELGVDLSDQEIDKLLEQMKAREASDKAADDKEGGVYKDEAKGHGDEAAADDAADQAAPEDAAAAADDDDEEEATVSFEEFKNFALREAFSKYDSNDSGYISAEELRSAAADLGVRITFARAQWLEKQYDKDGNGRLDFDEFKDAWLDFCTVRAKPEKKKMWVCDGLGCSWKELSPKTPEKRGWGWTWKPPTAEQGKEEALDDSKGFWDLLFPWEHTWDSEVRREKRK